MSIQVLDVSGSAAGAVQVLDLFGSVTTTSGTLQVLGLSGTTTAGGGTVQVLDLSGLTDDSLPTGATFRVVAKKLVQQAGFIVIGGKLYPLDTIVPEPGEYVPPPANTGLGRAPLGISPLGV